LAGAFLLALCLPLMLVIALAIASESPGPVLFRQRRNGWAGRLFTLFKFRTMHDVEPGTASVTQTRRNDPRCTRVGAFLRRTSLDELPQLWNVVIGDMSLVGPRPHADALHARERAGCELVAEYAQRQRVVPGMTGWAQVHGLRGGISSPEQLRRRVEFDLYYIDHWSLLLDLRILAMTPLAVLRAENAF
jgi:putative colanic acid biosynthesis UDP-glucose lipid carrier transferase